MLPLTVISNKSLIIGDIFLECLTEQVPGRNRNKTYQKPPKYSLLSAYCNCNPKLKLLEGSQSDLNVWKFKEVLIPSGEYFKLDFVKVETCQVDYQTLITIVRELKIIQFSNLNT